MPFIVGLVDTKENYTHTFLYIMYIYMFRFLSELYTNISFMILFHIVCGFANRFSYGTGHTTGQYPREMKASWIYIVAKDVAGYLW